MRTFSFVIPCYNHYELLHQVLYDIYQKCSPVDEVIVVDDASTAESFHNGLEWWKTNGMLPIRHIRNTKNQMFLKSSNIGMRQARGDVVCLISNDVRIHKDIVKQILSYDPAELLFIGGRYLDWDTGWNTFNNRVYGYLEGWLLSAPNEMWKELDYFDEQFAPSDMEDVDISTKAVEAGYTLMALPSDMTTHLGGQSIGFNPEREKITLANKEKFRKKWTTTNSKTK